MNEDVFFPKNGDKHITLPDDLFNFLFVLEINLLSILRPHKHCRVTEWRVLQSWAMALDNGRRKNGNNVCGKRMQDLLKVKLHANARSDYTFTRQRELVSFHKEKERPYYLLETSSLFTEINYLINVPITWIRFSDVSYSARPKTEQLLWT